MNSFLQCHNLPGRWEDSSDAVFTVAIITDSSHAQSVFSNVEMLLDLWQRCQVGSKVLSLHFVLPLGQHHAISTLFSKPHWPPPLPGFHFQIFGERNIVCTVYISSDFVAGIQCLDYGIDAWIIGGELCNEINFLKNHSSTPRATCSRLNSSVQIDGRIPKKGRSNVGSVAVIGCGIAGTLLSLKLCALGVEPVVFAPNMTCNESQLLPTASHNPVGIVAPRFDADNRPVANFFREAFSHAISTFYDDLSPPLYYPTGVNMKMDHEKAQVAAERSGWPLEWVQPSAQGLYFPKGGIARPRDLIEALSSKLVNKVPLWIKSVVQTEDRKWMLRNSAGEVVHCADVVVIATGANCSVFDQFDDFPINATRGRVSWTPISSSMSKSALKCLVSNSQHSSRGGYLAQIEDLLYFGATHERIPVDQIKSQTSHQLTDAANDSQRDLDNYDALCSQTDPELSHLNFDGINGRTSFRSVTNDTLPLAGNLATINTHHDNKNRKPIIQHCGGLYTIGGLGSRGLSTAPILADLIALKVVTNEYFIERQVLGMIQPARYLLRKIKRG